VTLLTFVDSINNLMPGVSGGGGSSRDKDSLTVAGTALARWDPSNPNILTVSTSDNLVTIVSRHHRM
jgi:hypothetical protein